MLVVKVELHSAVTGEVTELGRAVIANDASGTPEVGHYDCAVSVFDNQSVRIGRVEDHSRQTKDFWPLIGKAIAACTKEIYGMVRSD